MQPTVLTALFDLTEPLTQFVTDFKDTVTPALPIIMGGIVAFVGIKKVPSIFKAIAGKVG